MASFMDVLASRPENALGVTCVWPGPGNWIQIPCAVVAILCCAHPQQLKSCGVINPQNITGWHVYHPQIVGL